MGTEELDNLFLIILSGGMLRNQGVVVVVVVGFKDIPRIGHRFSSIIVRLPLVLLLQEIKILEVLEIKIDSGSGRGGGGSGRLPVQFPYIYASAI